MNTQHVINNRHSNHLFDKLNTFNTFLYQMPSTWPKCTPTQSPALNSVTSSQLSHQLSTQSPALNSVASSQLSHQLSTQSPAFNSVTSSQLSRQLSTQSPAFNSVTSSQLSHQLSTQSPALNHPIAVFVSWTH